MPTQRYTLWRTHEKTAFVKPDWESKIIPIYDVLSAKLVGEVTVAGLSTCYIEVNGYSLWSAFNPIPFTRPVHSIDIDISPYVGPGDNIFSIGVSALGAGIFTLITEIEYATQPPGPVEPPPEGWPWYYYAIIGVGAVVVIATVGPPLIRALTKKK